MMHETQPPPPQQQQPPPLFFITGSSDAPTTDATSTSYTVYNIEVRVENKDYSVSRRYSQFKALRSRLFKRVPGLSLPFPSGLLPCSTPSQICKRSAKLQEFLDALQLQRRTKIPEKPWNDIVIPFFAASSELSPQSLVSGSVSSLASIEGCQYDLVFSNKTVNDDIALGVRDSLMANGLKIWQQQASMPKDSQDW